MPAPPRAALQVGAAGAERCDAIWHTTPHLHASLVVCSPDLHPKNSPATKPRLTRTSSPTRATSTAVLVILPTARGRAHITAIIMLCNTHAGAPCRCFHRKALPLAQQL